MRNKPGNQRARAELNCGVAESVVLTEYMVRSPQLAVYISLIDVSHNAIQPGMVVSATLAILENPDRIPNEDLRTKVRFITFDVSPHFLLSVSLPLLQGMTRSRSAEAHHDN